MEKDEKNLLTRQDSLEKMCGDIRRIAKEVGYGNIWYPTMDNPSIICSVHSGLVVQTDILFVNAKHDNDGKPMVPDRSARYRSD